MDRTALSHFSGPFIDISGPLDIFCITLWLLLSPSPEYFLITVVLGLGLGLGLGLVARRTLGFQTWNRPPVARLIKPKPRTKVFKKHWPNDLAILDSRYTYICRSLKNSSLNNNNSLACGGFVRPEICPAIFYLAQKSQSNLPILAAIETENFKTDLILTFLELLIDELNLKASFETLYAGRKDPPSFAKIGRKILLIQF